MTITTIRLEVEKLRDEVSDPDFKAALNFAAGLLVPGMAILTCVWIGDMLLDTGHRAHCEGNPALGDRLINTGCEVSNLCDTRKARV